MTGGDASRPLRPDPQAGEGRRPSCSVRRTTAALPRPQPRPGARRPGVDAVSWSARSAKHIEGGGGGSADAGRGRRKKPEKIGEALDAGQELSSPRLLKVFALDYGSARTGVAVSDPTGTLARPLGVVERAGTEAGLSGSASCPRRGRRAGRRRPAADPARRRAASRPARPSASSRRCAPPSTSRSRRSTSGSRRRSPGRGPGEDARAAAHLLSSSSSGRAA